MIKKIRFYIIVAITYFRVSYYYKLHFAGMILQNVLTFTVLFLFFKWSGGIKGMTSKDLITYYLLLTAFFNHLIPTVDISFFNSLRRGKLDSIMTLPVSLNGYFVSMHFELLLFKLLIHAVIFILIALFVDIRFPSIKGGLMFLVATSISFIFYFIYRVFFTQFAYFVERADALSFWSYYLFMFLSGGLLPLQLFPDTFRKILYFTPFPYLIDYPLGIWLDRYSLNMHYLMIAIFYILIMTALVRIISIKGIKRYAAYGG